MPTYERPTKELMRDFAKEMLSPGQPFTRKDAVNWFAAHYPKTKPGPVTAHVEGMSVNSTLRHHHPSIKAGAGYDLFFKLGPSSFRLWDSANDPAPKYGAESGTQNGDIDADDTEPVDDAADSEQTSGATFAFERDLKNYLAKNLHVLEFGLTLYQEEGISGIEFPVGGRFIDILAIDKTGGYVVVELKVSRGYDRTVGQLLRYMAWVRKNLAPAAKVRGIIVANEITDDLKMAASIVPDVQLAEYEINFKLRPLRD